MDYDSQQTKLPLSGSGSPKSEEAITITVPIPMPTWNRILAMHHWQRKKLRDSIHELICTCIQLDFDSLTPTEYQQKQLLMESLKRASLEMIRPSSSAKSRTPRKKSAKKRARKKQS